MDHRGANCVNGARNGRTKSRRALPPASADHFVIILSQGRTGSTLILRMLNASPNVRICGENYRAFDHLYSFFECFRMAAQNHTSAFYRLAWLLPGDCESLMVKMRAFAAEVYNPGAAYRVTGFKEIRYCRFEDRSNLEEELGFLRELFPNLRVVFNVRKTEDCVKSKWWADDPQASAATLDRIRATFRDYYDRHPDHCYWMPFEELKHGSRILQGMFDFLDVPMTSSALQELDVRLRD